MSGYLLNLAETANLLYLKCIAGAFGAAFSNIVTVVYYMICSTACQAIFMYFPGIYRVTVHSYILVSFFLSHMKICLQECRSKAPENEHRVLRTRQ